jgi:predicted DNA-binding protein
MKSREPLEKPFNVLLSETMYLRLHRYASGLGVSKGCLIREALEDHFQKIDAENRRAR